MASHRPSFREGAPLGRTLIIANPAAQSGAGGRVAAQLQRFLTLYHHDAESFELVYTERARHAVELARRAHGFDSVLALGGDGVVHEVVNGLMQIDAEHRPALGVLPVGSGNDFARTLGIKDFEGRNFARLLTCERASFDVGRLSYDVPCADRAPDAPASHLTEHFIQTFSCGLDAAVAIGTYSLRKTTRLTGDALYLASGISVFTRRFRSYPLALALDGGSPEQLAAYLLAVQLGPTYGSGFSICPDADPADGFFDICLAAGRVTRATALSLLLRARNGSHRSSKIVSMRRARHVECWFDGDDYPMQADGEQIESSHVVIDILPTALTVLRPRG